MKLTAQERRRLKDEIRTRLRETPAGIPATQLRRLLGVNYAHLQTLLDDLPEVYVKKWLTSPATVRVLAIAEIPPDAPHPSKGSLT